MASWQSDYAAACKATIIVLIEKVKSNGKRVGVFPIEEDAWIDIGQWEKYRSALRRLN